MFIKSIIATTALSTSLVFTPASEAAEVSLEQFVGNMMHHAIVVTQQELKNNVQNAVLNAANSFTLYEENISSRVTITDLASRKNNSKIDDNKAE